MIMSPWRTVLPAVLAICALAGCGAGGRGGNALPPSPDSSSGRVGVDRLAPATGISGDRARARHDADAGALDESRGQPLRPVVPPESPQPPPQPAPASQL